MSNLKLNFFFQFFCRLSRFSLPSWQSALHVPTSAPPPPTSPPPSHPQPIPTPKPKCRRRVRQQRQQQGTGPNVEQFGFEFGVQRLGHDAQQFGRRWGSRPDGADGIGRRLGRGGGGRGQRSRWVRTSGSRHGSRLSRKRSVGQVNESTRLILKDF